jgi:hypothetical protein
MSDTTTGAATELAPTAAEATERLATLTKDKAWTNRLLSGDGPTRREFEGLISAKHEGDRVDAVMNGTAEQPVGELTNSQRLSTTALRSAVEHLRSLGLREEPLGAFMKGAPLSKEDRAWVDDKFRQLTGDFAWRERYLKGEPNAVQDMTALQMAKLRPLKKE